MNSFSNLYPDSAFNELEYIDFDSLLNTKINIIDAQPLRGKMGDYIAFKFTKPGDEKEYRSTTYSAVVADQLLRVKTDNNFPIEAGVTQVGKYFKLV